MRLHFEKHGNEEVLRILEAKYKRNYQLWIEGKWLPTKIQLKRMKISGFRFPTDQKTVPSRTKMEMINIEKPNLDFLVQKFSKKPLNENEPLANYRKSKKTSAKVNSQQSKKLKETIKELQGQLDNESKRVKDFVGKLANEQKNLKQVQRSCDLALKENTEIKVIQYT